MTSFSYADFVDDVTERTGGPDLTASDIQSIARSLHLTLNAWAAAGYNTWRVGETVLSLDGVASARTLSPRVDDVLAVRASSAADGNLDPRQGSWPTIERKSVDEYVERGDLGQTGRPSIFWLERGTPPKLHLHPIGVAGGAVHVVYVARPDDYDRISGGASALGDAPERWLNALVYSVAHDVARKKVAQRRLDREVRNELADAAADALRYARANDQPRTPIRVGIGRR